MKLPALQFYVGDWRKDIGVQSLNFHDRGVWFEIICLMHESDQRGKLILKGKPMTEEQIARVLGLDKQILTTTLTTLLSSGVADVDQETGAIMCRRMVRDENLRKIRSECGKRGGNPNLLKQNTTTLLKQNSNQNTEDEDEDEEALKEGGLGGNRINEIYDAYPLKVGKKAALKSIKSALLEISPEELLKKTLAYGKLWNGDKEFCPHPATWFNQGRYNDDPSTWKRHNGKSSGISIQDIRTVIQAKDNEAQDLRRKYCSEVATGDTWSDAQKRQEYFNLKREMKELNHQICGMA